MATNRQDIIDATIRCAYRVGLPAVTMSLIGKEVGILGQGLYNHFDSKEDILGASFDYCRSQLSGLFRDYALDAGDDLMESLKKLWMRFFTYLVIHPEECAFYRTYREFATMPPPSREQDDMYLKDLWRLTDELDAKFDLFNRVPRKTVLYYVRNLTPYLARAISDELMENTPEVREQLWLVAANGLSILTK